MLRPRGRAPARGGLGGARWRAAPSQRLPLHLTACCAVCCAVQIAAGEYAEGARIADRAAMSAGELFAEEVEGASSFDEELCADVCRQSADASVSEEEEDAVAHSLLN